MGGTRGFTDFIAPDLGGVIVNSVSTTAVLPFGALLTILTLLTARRASGRPAR